MNAKSLFLYLFFTTIFSSAVFAQQTCFNFDDSIMGTLQNKENAVDLFRGSGKALEGFISTNGSPSIYNSTTINYPSGKQCLLMGACGSNKAEGVAYNYTFQTNKSYQVTFKYRYYSVQSSNSPLSTFDVLLTNGLVHNNQGGCGSSNVVAIPSGSKNLLALTNYSDTAWQTATLNISGLTSAYAQLWLRINITQSIAAAPYLLIDDLCVKELIPATCFNFDDSIIGTLQNKENAVDLFRGVGQPLEGWRSVNGSPSIFSSTAVTYPSGKQCLLIGACGNNRSEGTALDYDFLAGTNYTVSFKYRYYSTLTNNQPLTTFDVLLTDSLAHNNQGGCGAINVITIPSGARNIFSQPNFSTATWQTASISVTGLTKKIGQIWWRINITGSTAAAPYLLIDDVCIEEKLTNGIENNTVNKGGFQLYPNPANNEVTIEFASPTDLKNIKIQLFDLLGKEIQNTNIAVNGALIHIQTAELPTGNYLVRISDENNNTQTKRLFISK